tara:strand:+ start:64 stop:516 length:453 start_codon:yes stop_codon:yes gene_type:complete
MNIEKVTYKLVKDALENGVISPFIMKMIISYLTDEQRGTIIDEIINERQSIEFKKGDFVWFDPKDNTYDFSSSGKKCYEEDVMKDSKLMNEHGYIKARIINDCSYKDECNPYATEYKIHAYIKIKDNGDMDYKEVRAKRSNIIALWKALE